MSNLLGPDTFRGVTIVDLTRLLPGPFATMLFADLGARVIKIEAPKGGDYARWTPPVVEMCDGGYGAFFESLNRGKESVGLDLKSEAGLDLFRRIVANADVVIESFRPGVLERLGVGPAALRTINSRLIVCSISSYGQDGPLSSRAGHDINFLARSGMLGLTGPASDVPGIPSVQVGDIAGGALHAAFGIAAALFRRERTGLGATLDISMTEGVLSMLGPVVSSYSATGVLPERGADALTGAYPCYRVYTTSDHGYLAVGALEPKFWGQFVHAIERPEWIGDGLVSGAEAEAAIERIQGVIGSKTLAEWTVIFGELDACVEPIKPLDQVVADALFRARSAIRETPEDRLQVFPPTSRGIAGLEKQPPPLLGEHTRATAQRVGLSADVIEAAIAAGSLAANER